MQKVRICINNGDGTCSQTPYCTDGTNIYPMDITFSGRIGIENAKAQGGIIISQNQFQKILNMNANGNSKIGIGYGETPGGAIKTFRDEIPTQATEIQVLKISVFNTTPVSGEGSATKTFTIFDKLGLCARSLGVSPATMFTGVSISGNYGTDTAAYFAAISGDIPLDLHEINVLQRSTTTGEAATTDTFFDNGQMALMDCTRKLDGSPADQAILDFSMVYDGTQYNENVRLFKDFRFQAMAATGIKVTLTPQTGATIAFYLSAAGLGAQMVKQ